MFDIRAFTSKQCLCVFDNSIYAMFWEFPAQQELHAHKIMHKIIGTYEKYTIKTGPQMSFSNNDKAHSFKVTESCLYYL